MSLTVDRRRLWDACEDVHVEGVEKSEEVSEPMEDVGDSARMGGGVARIGLDSSSKGELDGEA